MIHRFANPTYLRRMLRRAALFWAAIRVVLLSMSVALGLGLGVSMSPLATLLIAAVVAILCQTDAHFMRESLFWANLGTPAWAPAAVGGALSLAAELFAAFVGAVMPLLQ